MLRFTSAIVIQLLCIVAAQSSTAAPKVVLVAGGGDGGEGTPAIGAKIDSPFGVDFDRAGNLYLVEMTGQRVRRIDKSGQLTTIAGDGTKGSAGDGGPVANATFNGMHALAMGPDNTLYLADTWNNCVRAIELDRGAIRRIIGTGEKGYSGDGGQAIAARFGGIYCASLNPSGDKVYLADLDNRRIRQVDLATGLVSTVAGNGVRGAPDEGALAVKAPLVDPRAVAVDKNGNVYVLERSGHALRVVDSAGKIRTLIGTGKAGASDGDGDARTATLNGPKHLCLDHDGNVIIADTENHLIRKYIPREQKIIRIVGSGRKGSRGIGGQPLEVELNQPHGVYVHRDGTLFISDSSNHRVLKVVNE